jgi:hypothetical protein
MFGIRESLIIESFGTTVGMRVESISGFTMISTLLFELLGSVTDELLAGFAEELLGGIVGDE